MSATHPDESKLTRLCMIGCGRLATSRIWPCFPRLPVRLVGVCDLDESLANRNARRHGGERVFTDLEKMLDETRPDGVVLCVGPRGHYELGLKVLAKGYPLYTEKPPAPTAAQAWELAEASRRAGVLCMTAFKYRYAPAMVKAKKIVDSPEFGGVHALNVLRTCGGYPQKPGEPVHYTFLSDFCIHPIDEALFLGGAVKSVYATAPTPDGFAIALSFANGGVGGLTFSCHGTFSRPVDRVEILGNRGHAITIEDEISMTYFVEDQPRQQHRPYFCTAGGDSLKETGFLTELEAFVKHLRGELSAKQVPSRIEESTQSMALFEAILKSAQTGQAVAPRVFEREAAAVAS
ncbi:MAG: Gfo/Idh/MocA family oxidoreductase [Planctomycetota bacterium]|nr:Gfo/Idh/MocA family oxidoreductase [Planctomycetota bacterium]